ncbi:retrotransposon ty3-gypsy subclass [Cystoisospora suis]|uniref:Retrotransposon ty3-gypsy subclass n=1 Tax=Cystoisospora suis TaxID=483139 RepID=A0A2C6KQR6_9APIC|nr:retrotransposon ty3-gypsy subclass [Cystoisospora suis]
MEVRERPVKHQIKLIPGEVPQYPTQNYNLSSDDLAELKRQIKNLLEKKFIEPTQAPFAAPVVLVPKPGGEGLRMIVDYKALNRITLKDEYPLPRIQDLIQRLGKAGWFTKLDLQKGYYQVQVAPEDQWKTAFKCRYGTFQIRVGLARAPSTFQRLMQNVFINELDEFVVVYLDDVLVYSESKAEHLNHLRRVLQRIKDQQLSVGIRKCGFVTQKVKYLGYIIEQGRMSPGPRRVKALKSYPEKLENVRQARGFLGLVGNYRQLIKDFNRNAKPLHDLLKEKRQLVWSPKHSQAVKELKDASINVTMTNSFNPDLPLVLKTDASKYAVGAVLEQDGKPIAFESRKKLGREIYYPAYESELLANIYAPTKWKHFNGTRLVTIETDHATLSRMLTQGYWLDKLADFNFQVVYKAGKQNLVADALSRRPDYMEGVAMMMELPEARRGNRRTSRDTGSFIPRNPICQYGLPMTVPAANLPFQAETTLRKAKLELEKAQTAQQFYANSRRRAVEFQEGDKVWLLVSHLPTATISSLRALALRYKGPFKIIGKVGKRAYRLKSPPSMLMHPVFHVSLLKPWRANISEFRNATSSQLAIQGNEYGVRGIFKHREDFFSKEKWYKVLWMDGTSTWEPESNLEGCPQVLTNYYRGIQRPA